SGTRTAFHVRWVDAVLFPQGVGFLVLKVVVDDTPITTASYAAFLRCVKKVLFRRRVLTRLPLMTVGSEPFQWHGWLDEVFGTLPVAVPGNYVSSIDAQIYGSNFRSVSLVATEEDSLAVFGSTPSEWATDLRGVHPTALDALAWELHSGHSIASRDRSLGPDGLSILYDRLRLSYW